MVSKRLLSIFIVLFLSLTLFAQKDFKPGYIITNQQDTIYGQISLSSSYSNNRKCVFISEGEAETIYSPFEIYGYRIDDLKFYVSKEVEINDKKEKVFLEYLVNGVVNLYYLKDMSSDYYFMEKDDVFYPLTNDEIITVNEYGDEYARKSKKYIGALNYYFSDSPELNTKIKTTEFTHKSMINITKDYHNYVCTEYACIDYVKNVKTGIFIEPLVGINYSTFRFRTSDDKAIDITPLLGINLRVAPMKNHSMWNIVFGLHITNEDFSNDFIIPNDYGRNESYRVSVNHSKLSIPIGVDYTFPTKKVCPYISGSFVNEFIINGDYNSNRVSVFYDGTEYVSSGPKSDYRFYQFGLQIGGGLRYMLKNERFFQLGLSYKRTRPALQTGYFFDPINISAFGLNISYSFAVN